MLVCALTTVSSGLHRHNHGPASGPLACHAANAGKLATYLHIYLQVDKLIFGFLAHKLEHPRTLTAEAADNLARQYHKER